MAECVTRNVFDSVVESSGKGSLRADGVERMQVNLGFRCNQACKHCHVGGSPDRDEMMEWSTMELVAAAARSVGCYMVDVTGGAPELHPQFRRFVSKLREEGLAVQVRTNLTVHFEPGMESTAEFLRDLGVMLVASMPCYLEKNVCAQRGDGVYEKSIECIRHLNAIGYGIQPELPLNLVYNPMGPSLPPEQSSLEADYRREFSNKLGIEFTSLLTITNMPIGRFLAELRSQNKERDYLDLLKRSFNPTTIDGLMCRRQVSVGWDGTLYDCDFNLVLRLPVNHGVPAHIGEFDAAAVAHREIVTGEHCFGCTAGSGSSCGGALVG